ncbi:conserved hypothetical protein [Uncinocarpus reesii 1704]|uniref:CID domain-containing protein n=1 Tax=Uncinocarpus reesii (strain UAMH 1704) TaxID=336963 RepID=C4JM43_UNCRE|nr:uncharacterized protein UREG_03901 [Uncinocarpus reesii 1704]EEP79055.1 conserved hypothetical protein [Uncinocarpus reesii 1704]
MTSHQLAIAKASFSAGLLRPDPTSVPRDRIIEFHDALDTMLAHCSPANIQTSSKRKRLHILYLLNDLLHHTKYHSETALSFVTLTGSLQPCLVELFALAAQFDREKNPKHFRRLTELLDIWEENGYYSSGYVDKLRETVANPGLRDALSSQSAGNGTDAEPGKPLLPKDVPYIIPATHGDPTAPYHELPTGNLLPHIIPNSSVPIKPQSVKALQLDAGPAEESLIRAVKSLLDDVDQIYGTRGADPDTVTEIDIDELGQIITRDATTGEFIDADAYYGWSRSFCQKMQQRKSGKSRSRSSSQSHSDATDRSRSRSRSYTPIKRRRYSDSRSIENERRSRSPESSDSPRYRRRNLYSRSPSHSRSPPRRRRLSHSRSGSYSPPAGPRRPFSPPRIQQKSAFSGASQPPPPPPPPPAPLQPPFNIPQQFNPQRQPSGSPSAGMFVPPPRPPGYHGPWPPPPPPPPPALHNQHGFSGGTSFPQAMNMSSNVPGFSQPFMPPMPGAPFVPPPPPPGQSQQGHGLNPAQGQHGAFQFPPTHPGQSSGQGYHGGSGGWSRGAWS